MSEPSENPPKIIVDDDWKTQVEKEKRAAAQAGAGGGSAAAPESNTDAAPSSVPDATAVEAMAAELRGAESGTAQAEAAGDPHAPPPATFEMLVTMLFTQAMAALGQLPGPDGKLAPVNKAFAKYFIDSVELLGEKTKGNLTADESKMISETLHAMRMAFVSVKAK